MNAPVFLSRGIDYLGDLGAKLRDLQGYKTLAHELIQNADDVASATSMTFHVRTDALVVDNDGVFSDCQAIELPECPWKEDGAREEWAAMILADAMQKQGDLAIVLDDAVRLEVVIPPGTSIQEHPGILSSGTCLFRQ
jgi:hypothetical protein